MRKILLALASGTVFGVAVIILMRLPFDPSWFGLGVALIFSALMFWDKAKTVA